MIDKTIRIDIPLQTFPNGAPGNDAGDKTIVVGTNAMPGDDDMMVITEQPVEGTLRQKMMPQQAAVTANETVFDIKGEQFFLKKTLSDSSGEAQVFLVTKDEKEYVLKVYYPNFNINKKLLQVIRNIHFEMIVRLINFGKTWVDAKNRNYELMEFLRGGTLHEYRLNGDFNKFRRIALQGAAALAYCHKNNIVHKDIKPQNFFFRDEAHTQLVLGDFGISSMMEYDGQPHRTTQARTPIFAAPEMYTDVIDGEVEITPAVDFYSLGITLFTLWLGETPMSSNERLMMKQKNEGRLPRINELPEKVKRIVQGLTAVNVQSRWGYNEVERWFLGEDVAVDVSSPFLRYKSFVVDPEKNLVAENVHELIPMLLDNEALAVNYLYTGRIATWLETSGNGKLATIVKNIIANKYPTEQKAGLMSCVYAMEPTYPYVDISGNKCDDIHDITVALLKNISKYAITLQNPNDSLFLWLESHTKSDIERLRSYVSSGADTRIGVLRIVFETDPDLPFLAQHPSATVKDIVRSFGSEETTEDDWHALCDGRLLSWLYAREDITASESVKKLTEGKTYSQSLAYKVLYDLDKETGYDLKEAKSPAAIGRILAQRLMQAQHLPDTEFVTHMEDFILPEGRFAFYIKIHGWHDYAIEASRCLDLKLDENRDRLGVYDIRTALYRLCRILGATPTYMMPGGVVLDDGRNIPQAQSAAVKEEMRQGSFCQWLSVFFHEDPAKDFSEQYTYEKELEKWLMELGNYDNRQQYYVRFIKAREQTTERIAEVRKMWNKAKSKEQFWKYVFFGLCAIWICMVLIVGFNYGQREYILNHPGLTLILPVGGITGLILSTRAYFNGYGTLLSLIAGGVGVATSAIPMYILKYIGHTHPSLFSGCIVMLTIIYALISYFTDFSRGQHTDKALINDILSSDDVNSSLIEPLYYTFKTKSYRYKSSKFGLLDDLVNQVRSLSGESVLHYIEWSLMVILLIGELAWSIK